MPLPIPVIVGVAIATKVVPAAIAWQKFRKARDAGTDQGEAVSAENIAPNSNAFVRVGMPRGRR